MSGFWDKKKIKTQEEAYQEAFEAQPIQLDEEAVAEMQEEQFEIFDEEEEDTSSIMADANLRLEMGRLYQMIMRHDLFGDTDADPKAIKIVQREIRKLVREKMEIMLGIRQEQAKQEMIVSSPFNDTEVTVLKMLASRASKGRSEDSQQIAQGQTQEPPAPPKKDGITAINGNLRPQTTPQPLRKTAKPLEKQPVPKPKQPVKSALTKEEETLLTKPINEMTTEELVAYDAAALERRAKNKSAMPNNMVPHPNAQQLEMLYTQSASNLSIANPWRTAPSQ